MSFTRVGMAAMTMAAVMSVPVFAQNSGASEPPAPQDHSQHSMDMSGSWQFMQDGALSAIVNRQGGARGGTEGVGTSWYMGMWRRQFETRRLTLSAMLSADPLVSGADGYREIFQVGEVLDGRPLVDRQHPHDAFMQLSAAWRTSIGDRGAVTLAGGPVGAPALGPVASCTGRRLQRLSPRREP